MIKIISSVLLYVILSAAIAYADDVVRVYVPEVTVVGSSVASQGEIKQIIQSLLRSQVTSTNVLAVEAENEAKYILKVTYVRYSGVNNIDTVILANNGNSLMRLNIVFKDDSQLVQKLDEMSIKIRQYVLSIPSPSNIISNSKPTKKNSGTYLIESDNSQVLLGHDSVKTKINEDVNQFAVVKNELGDDQVLLVGDRKLFTYINGKITVLKEWQVGNKIINTDKLNFDNKQLIVLTRVDRGEAISDIYEYHNNNLIPFINNQKTFMKVLHNVHTNSDVLYVQDQGPDSERFYGDVYEANIDNKSITRKMAVKLPRYASIYNFNYLYKNNTDDRYIVVFDDNRYLLLYDKNFVRVWKSNSKFGGSELMYQVKDLKNFLSTGREYKNYFMEQRILALPDSSIMVARNDGSLVVGDARVFQRGSIYTLQMNDNELEEKWHTKESQKYLQDYYYDGKKGELYQLFLVRRDDPINRESAMSEIVKYSNIK